MTISYSRSSSLRHLFSKWKGSIWKTCWFELFIFLALYYLVRVFYNVVLPYFDEDDDKKYRRAFEHIAIMFDDYIKQIPLTFLLGFYVSTIVKRWWTQFEYIVWPDDIVTLLCLLFPGTDHTSRLRRHAIARYLNLTAALAWRDISQEIRRRFPTIKHIVASGLMTEVEETLYESLESKAVRWYVPLHWAQKIIVAEIDDKGKDAKPLSSLVKIFMSDLKQYRTSFRKLYSYDWVCVPLVYTQVAALATYGYFAFCLMGRQFLDPAKKYKNFEIDFVVPVFTIVQFLFFIGWFKVGQDLLRPLGTDDDDFELNYILDRNIRTSFAIVNAVETAACPQMVEDNFWSYQDKLVPPVAHTELSAKLHEHPPKLHSYVELKNYDDDEISDIQTSTVGVKEKYLQKGQRKR
uniref:Bestrophin homolog n=1 Tax=Plectus sambesii TaxID=2011161 RepID=A0A914UVE2_9BILA